MGGSWEAFPVCRSGGNAVAYHGYQGVDLPWYMWHVDIMWWYIYYRCGNPPGRKEIFESYPMQKSVGKLLFKYCAWAEGLPSEYCSWQMPSTVALMVELRIRSLCQQQRLKLQDVSIFYSHYLHRMRFFVCRRLAMYLPCALHCRALSGSARSLAW